MPSACSISRAASAERTAETPKAPQEEADSARNANSPGYPMTGFRGCGVLGGLCGPHGGLGVTYAASRHSNVWESSPYQRSVFGSWFTRLTDRGLPGFRDRKGGRRQANRAVPI